MLKVSSAVIALTLLCLAQTPLWAQEKFPVVSANGFSCSQNNGMVTCRGSFPDSPSPVIESSGNDVVWIRTEFADHRYTYYSDSGCLCRADFKAQGEVNAQQCTSHFGHQKIFKGGKSTYDWCKNN